MKKVLSLLLCIITVFSLFGINAGAKIMNKIYVSVSGNDSWDGSLEKPFATINKAKEKAKFLDGDVVVYIRGGKYTLNETINFSSSDKSNVTFKAYNKEDVCFTSGVPYTDFEECTVNGVKAFKKNVGKQADFNALFSEKELLSRTRYPESGYLYVEGVDKKDAIDKSIIDTVHCGYDAMLVKKDDIKNFKNYQDVLVRILHYWKDEMVSIKSYDSSKGYMEFSRFTSMTVAKNDRYFLENVFEALNEPGEWYLDKAEGILYYIPKAGETTDITLWGSSTETMINIDGADGISFEGITFRGNGFNIPGNNIERDKSSQAGFDATSCISYNNAKNFHIKNCNFKDISACAVFLGVNVKEAKIDSNSFNNIGAQAVYIRGENVQLDDGRITKNISVTNNLIKSYGRTFFNSVGILLIHANSVEISNNEISDGYYTAISAGWVWGYGYTVTNNIKICNNLIYNIGQGWLSDMGGIYMLGVQPDTVISGNVIHNVAADPGQGGYGGWGIYLDEGSSGMLVEKNLAFACGNDSYHLHYGANNVIRNNIFALSGESQIRVCSRFENHKTAEFYRNIILTDKKASAFSHVVSTVAFDEHDNLFWDLTYGYKIFINREGDSNNSYSFETAIRKGYIHNPTVMNPSFKNAENFNFEFSSDCAIDMIGFEKWDYSEAGTVKGTVVGTNIKGGTTPYNSGASTQEYTPSREPFHFIIALINKIYFMILNYFNK